MQLQLEFPAIEDLPKPENHSADAYMDEFRQGDFSHAMRQTRYSSKELLHILLTSTTTWSKILVEHIEALGDKINGIARDVNNEYKDHIRRHNDEIRQRLTYLFAHEDSGYLCEHGWDKFWKYNNAHREMYGGKHFDTLSVENPEHERYDRYLLRRKQHIQYCISEVVSSTLSDKITILKHYISNTKLYENYTHNPFPKDEFIEAVCAMDMKESYQKDIVGLILENCRVSELVELMEMLDISEDQRNFIIERISKTPKIEDETRACILEEIQKSKEENLS